MTNEKIIMDHAFQLMEQGKIHGSGQYGTIIGENGEEMRVELPEEIHTFAYWKSHGRSVKKGEKAVDTFGIWKHTRKMLNTDTGDAETDKMNAAVNAEGGQENMFRQNASFFTFDQTEPTEEREKRSASKKANRAEKSESAPSPAADAELNSSDELPDEQPCAEFEQSEPEQEAPHYYEINEELARRHKENISFFDYKPGSATASYRSEIDKATKILNDVLSKCKTQDQRDHARRLYDAYCRKLAEYINKDNEIGTRCPSVLIAGGSNFPVNKKAKQVAAWDRNMEKYKQAEELLEKLRGVYRQGIRSNDPEAIEVLRAKLVNLEAERDAAKERNAEARRNKTAQPVPSWYFQNISATIRNTRARIEALEQAKNTETVSQAGDGYTYEENTSDMRIRFVFAGKPDEKTREILKSNGFRWAPSVGAWQRQLTDNARLAALRVKSELSEI